MSRYIDKETMRGIIREQEKSHGIRGLAWIEMAMDKQEDADVQKVSHGKWVLWGMFDDFVKCSCCGYQDTRNHVIYENLMYCGKCGAKMDEEEV